MWPWNASTRGYVYLFHFHRPLGNLSNPRAMAAHYVGFTEDLDARLAEQLAGRGAKIIAAAVAQGITFEIYHWPACLAVEKLVKATHKTALYCPRCAALSGRRPRSLPKAATQLALPLDDCDDLPPAPPLRIDGYEIWYTRQMRAARAGLVPQAAVSDTWDDGLL